MPLLWRLALLFFVQDFEADAYARMQLAAQLAEAIRQGKPFWPALYVPVWPPCWQLLCAGVELLLGNAYFVPKILAAIFGGLTPVVVFALARRISAEPRAWWLSWLMATLAPLHVLYSTSGMSEAFYIFWFLFAAWLFLCADTGNRWLILSALALLPGALTRFDGWILLPALVPLALWQKRASLSTALLALAVAGLGPILWFALVWRVTGDPRSFLVEHTRYVRHFYQTYKLHDLYANRGPLGLGFHLLVLLSSTGALAVVGGVVAVRQRQQRDARGLCAWLLVALVYLEAMWLIKRQVGWRRHYLGIGLGLYPFVASWLVGLERRTAALLVGADLLFVLATSAPFAYVPRRFAQAAAFVKPRDGRVYTDEPGVRIISQLPAERLVSDAPRLDPAAETAWLEAHDVRWVVFSEVDYSPLGEVYPWMKSAGEVAPFHLAYTPPSNHAPLPRVLVYELR